MSKRTGIAALDNKPTVWQINWVFPVIELGNMLTDKGDRLWLTVALEDLTGRTTATMNGNIALSLSGRTDKEEFLRAVRDGDPVFPTVLSANIVRRLKTLAQDESNEINTFVNNNIVAASAQDTNVSRTSTCLSLIGMLRASATLSSAILPASLSMLMPSKLYPLLVQYQIANITAQSCKNVWVLIKATKKSTCTDEPPYQVTTDGVEDVFDAAEPDAASEKTKRTYKMISMCNKNNRTSLMLAPAHGKHVYALVVITAIRDDTVYAAIVESVQRDEKEQLAKAIRQEMTLAIRFMQRTVVGKTTPWDETTSPLASS